MDDGVLGRPAWYLPATAARYNKVHVPHGPHGGQFAKKAGNTVVTTFEKYGTLHNEAPTSADAKKHYADLAKLPDFAADKVAAAGVHFYIGDKALPDMDSLSHLKGVRPRGFAEGSTWADAGGGYDYKNKTVVAGDDTLHLSTSLALHEAGHAIDAALGGGSSATARSQKMGEHHARLYPQLQRYLRQGGQGSIAGKSEMFAEGVADVLTNEKVARHLYDDEFVDWLLDVLNGKAKL